MEELLSEIAAEKKKSSDIQLLYDEEKILRIKAEESLKGLKKIHGEMAIKGEMSEEFIVNKLLHKINEVKHDKERLAVNLESEEECLTNNLQRQLRTIKTEKEETEAEVRDLKHSIESMQIEKEKVLIHMFNSSFRFFFPSILLHFFYCLFS